MHFAHQRAYALPYHWYDAQSAHAQTLIHKSVVSQGYHYSKDTAYETHTCYDSSGHMQGLCIVQAGHHVLGGYMSPVNDAYHKPGLLPAQHRIAMCQLAAAESGLIMVDTWEAAQADAQRSLVVLGRVQQAMQDHYSKPDADPGHQQREQQASKQAGNSSECHDAALQQTAGSSGSSLAAPQGMQHQHQHQSLQVSLAVHANLCV